MEPDARNRVPDTARRDAGASGATRAADALAPTDLADSLLPLAISQPEAALASAESLISSETDPTTLSVAHQAAAIIYRDRGRTDTAVAHGFTALRHARRVSAERQGDVLATLGTTLIYAGRTSDGLKRLDEALTLTPQRGLPRLLVRRGNALTMLARYREAVDDLTQAIDGCHRAQDTLWEGRALNNRFDAYLALGETDAAERDAVQAAELLSSVGQDFEAAQAVHNQGLAAHLRGDLPAALTLLDEAAERYGALGNVRHDLIIERTQVLLTAGLIDEARDLCTDTLASTERAPIRRAELLLTLARAALAQGDTEAAERSADEAARLFAAQLRGGWADRARLLRLRAQYLADHPDLLPWMVEPPVATARMSGSASRRTSRMLREATALVESMRERRATELNVALVLHGRIAHGAGRDDDAQRSLAAASATRQTGPPLSRAAAWFAQALLAQHRGDRRALFHACRQGLDAVDEHRSTLGDIELRALASGHGIELARLAIAEAVRGGRSRQMLWWTERWRAAALNGSATRPSEPGLRRDLAALRDVTRRLEPLDATDAASQTLVRERTRLEASVRRVHRHLRAEGSRGDRRPGEGALDLGSLLDALGEADTVLTLVHDRGRLHLVTVARGRVTRREVGPLAAAEQEAEFARFTLRRAAHGRPVDLSSAGRRLQDALLGVAPPPTWSRGGRRPHGDEGPSTSVTGRLPHVVVVPPADLLTAPWGLLPVFDDVVLSVSPSISQWLRARRVRPDAERGSVALVTGPNLTTREAEVSELRRIHRGARVLGPSQATVAAALALLDGADLAHVAAHGQFRANAPLFSALQLADGPLTVHDLQQLRRPPRSMVLSACDSGGAASIGPYEALGLVSSLLGMGTSGVLASVVPVNDQATLEVMAEVHGVAGAGGTLAEGWLAARQAGRPDPLLAATAASFTAWGA
ncbi:hypothetical protein N865_06930 [Intrasporangium oryzae NRRL B-24470]|uniref:CHAT domain-containing protein n=1 Tax=Intrasporangium oryzae NRRL B-24470 TaxID=1386089 RepID=W9G7A4_9MICO|nr:CHAT domain-containing protein [Intrasporangium oryzae]EWT02026.1 hypothetical protein N865_06930 [Intrasporangium oryzae NRRL B-24470]